jgi:hypothetical protein
MMEDLTREDLLAAVDAVIADLLEAARVHQPPVDAVTLARRHLGIAMPAEAGRQGGSNSTSPERRQWNTAQEIGATLKPRILEWLGIPREDKRALTGESVSTLFAFRLLLPTPWFIEAARGCEYDLPALQEQFSTASSEVIALRLLDLDEPCIITIHDNGSIVRRKGNAYRPPKTLARAERECLEQVCEYSRPYTTSADGWRVQGWPVHTVDWRREILRSVVDEEAVSSENSE